jgi:hypothetical protein
VRAAVTASALGVALGAGPVSAVAAPLSGGHRAHPAAASDDGPRSSAADRDDDTAAARPAAATQSGRQSRPAKSASKTASKSASKTASKSASKSGSTASTAEKRPAKKQPVKSTAAHKKRPAGGRTEIRQTDLGAAVDGVLTGVSSTVSPLTHLTLNPLAETGVDPLDNSAGAQIADFRTISTASVTGHLSKRNSLATLPLLGPVITHR